MSRADGRKHRSPRPVEIAPETPEGDSVGASPRSDWQGGPSPIPGGRQHLTNPVSVQHKIPVPAAKPEVRDLNDHGVPVNGETTWDRADQEQGPREPHNQPRPKQPERNKVPAAVPVYLVEQAGNERPYRSAYPRHFSLPAAGGDPVRICGRDKGRSRILLLNEYVGTAGSTTGNIRFAQNISELVNGGGSLLPWPQNGYLNLETQDELYAISADTSTPIISVIQEFEHEAAV